MEWFAVTFCKSWRTDLEKTGLLRKPGAKTLKTISSHHFCKWSPVVLFWADILKLIYVSITSWFQKDWEKYLDYYYQKHDLRLCVQWEIKTILWRQYLRVREWLNSSLAIITEMQTSQEMRECWRHEITNKSGVI